MVTAKPLDVFRISHHGFIILADIINGHQIQTDLRDTLNISDVTTNTINISVSTTQATTISTVFLNTTTDVLNTTDLPKLTTPAEEYWL